jgi:hypothetical protein
MRFGTQIVTGLTAALVIALSGTQAVSAGTLSASQAGVVRSSNIAANPRDDCYPVQGFKSAENGLYVAAELNYDRGPENTKAYGMLRARADTVGAWEKFQFCFIKFDHGRLIWAIFSNANDRWVAAEIDYPTRVKGELRARAEKIGPWEEFYVECIPGSGGQFTIQSVANQKFVAAELGYRTSEKEYGMLRARAGAVGAWERFYTVPLSSCSK